KNRFAYFSYARRNDNMEIHDQCFSGFVKFDLLAEEEIAFVSFGKKRCGGEMVFVPKNARGEAKNSLEEDDGYLITYVYDEKTKLTDFVAYNAKELSAKPLFTV